MSKLNQYADGVKDRAVSIRLRTIILTGMIVLMLILYCIVQLILNQRINVVDMILIGIIQVLTFSAYYPEGQNYGSNNKVYLANKKTYNEKANYVNNNQLQAKLGEYCEYEYKKRKHEWYENQCGILGITTDDLDKIKQSFTEQEVKKLESITTKRKKDDKHEEEVVVHFGRKQRKRLHSLIFNPCPVEKNEPDAILSACEIKREKRIIDGSLGNTNQNIGVFILRAIIMMVFFGYLGYALRDGFSFANIMQFGMFFGTMVGTAVTAYSNGETNIKTHKNRYYIELTTFLNGMFEWAGIKPTIEEKEEE